jgi:hypothetical protein
MSIFSVFGKIGSTIGKAALGAAGGVVGINGLSTIFDKSHSTGGAPPASAPSINIGDQPTGSQNIAGGSLMGSVTDFLGSATSFLKGGAKVNVNASLGNTTSGVPTWLPIAGIGLVLVLLLKGGSSGGRRRY